MVHNANFGRKYLDALQLINDFGRAPIRKYIF